MASSSPSPPPISSMPEYARKAYHEVDINTYSKYVGTLQARQKDGAWNRMWGAALARGGADALDQLESIAPGVCPDPLLRAISSNNVYATKWLLERGNFIPGGDPRPTPDELTDEEHFKLMSTLDSVIRNTNHDRKPVFKAVAFAVQKYPQGISDAGNFHKLGSCISSAYVHKDLDAAAVLINAAGIYLRNSLTTVAQDWASRFLLEAPYEIVIELIKNRNTHADFGRAWNALLPMSVGHLGYEAKTSWEVILLEGGRSALDFCTRLDSPMPSKALDVLADDKNFKLFLEKTSSRAPDLAKLLTSNSQIAEKFHHYQAWGENSLHVLLHRMPHYTFSPKWGRLTSWLDKNAPEMFSKPFSDGRTVDEFLKERAPMWHAKRRRNSLMEISRQSGVKRTQSRSGRLM